MYLDHIYFRDVDHKVYESLGERGFSLAERTARHPGSFCKFIHLNNGQYLEFISPEGEQAHNNMVGISFGYENNLIELKEKLDKQGFKTEYEHRSYNWKDDNNKGIGWNFLKFPEIKIEGFYLWITEYELDDKMRIQRAKNLNKTTHSNTLKSFNSLELGLNEENQQFFKAVFELDKLNGLKCSKGVKFNIVNSEINKLNSVNFNVEDNNIFQSYTKNSNKENSSLDIFQLINGVAFNVI